MHGTSTGVSLLDARMRASSCRDIVEFVKTNSYSDPESVDEASAAAFVASADVVAVAFVDSDTSANALGFRKAAACASGVKIGMATSKALAKQVR